MREVSDVDAAVAVDVQSFEEALEPLLLLLGQLVQIVVGRLFTAVSVAIVYVRHFGAQSARITCRSYRVDRFARKFVPQNFRNASAALPGVPIARTSN